MATIGWAHGPKLSAIESTTDRRIMFVDRQGDRSTPISVSSALDLACSILHANANDFATSSTSNTVRPRNQYANGRQVLLDQGASLSTHTVSQPSTGNPGGSATVGGMVIDFQDPWAMATTILWLAGQDNALAALNKGG